MNTTHLAYILLQMVLSQLDSSAFYFFFHSPQQKCLDCVRVLIKHFSITDGSTAVDIL